MGRKRAPELVHGLEEPVLLKDWEFAIILSALKLYAEISRGKGRKGSAAYAERIRRKLRVPFARLIKRTKKEHRRIKSSMTHHPLSSYEEEPPG